MTHVPSWPASMLGEAVATLIGESRLSRRSVHVPPPPPLHDDAETTRWLDAVARVVDVEITGRDVTWNAVDRLLGEPMLVRLANGRFLTVVRGHGRTAVLLDPEHGPVKVRTTVVRDAIRGPAEEPVERDIAQFLDDVQVAPGRRIRAREALLRSRIGEQPVARAWRMVRPQSVPFTTLLRDAGVLAGLGVVLAAEAVQYVVWLAVWAFAARWALGGGVDGGWMTAWVLSLLSIVPLRALSTWMQGLVLLRGAEVMKRRLLFGVLRLDPDELRASGIGRRFGQAAEAEAFEAAAYGGTLQALIGAVELVVACVALGAGAGGWLHVFALLLFLIATAMVARSSLRRRREWASRRVAMTHRMIEVMIGHRTRVAQQRPSQWHEEEDRDVRDHLAASASMDRMQLVLAAAPAVWIVLAVAALLPAFVAGAPQLVPLAISVGALLLAAGSIGRLTGTLPSLFDALIAWGEIGPVFRAAERTEVEGRPEFAVAPAGEVPVVDAVDLSFAYERGTREVLRGCTFRIVSGDRVLLEAPSGGGKSTLASLLAGLRRPASGVLLLQGLDLHTLGADEWRHRAAAAPQFHENHVFSETLSFNLLMGRGWPPRRADIAEAEEVCRELGLGELLDRMPARMLQMIGEAGWQLSHGEKSRLYVARALLQRAELVILDESFAALDPANFARCLETVTRRARSLLLIAHV
ncbi:MAG TPA: ABC transporter ATP-binding protein [Thermoanaerobaculia bacterium]|jgi:ATP-binding cassette subfamily B protein